MGILVSLIQLFNLPTLLTLIIQILLGAVIYIGLSAILKLESFEYLWSMARNIISKRKA